MAEQSAFQIDANDSVATALVALIPGPVAVRGDAPEATIQAIEAVPQGHKIALRAIPEGSRIIKYGISIGHATRPVAKGGWVHLHCMESNFDEKSASLDPVTGVSTKTQYR